MTAQFYDNMVEAKNMGNHRNRPEIADALKNGFGETVHLSKTLGTQTFYRVVRLNDGTVLRVSATTNSVFKSVLGFIQYVVLITLLVILLTMIIANLLAKKLIRRLDSSKILGNRYNLVKMRKGDCTGTRNYMSLLFAYHTLQTNEGNLEQTLQDTHLLNNSFTEPERTSQENAIVRTGHEVFLEWLSGEKVLISGKWC